MQLSFPILLAIATLVSAQTGSIQGAAAAIPACARQCLQTAISASGCGPTDFHCQCTSGEASILASASPCIVSGCSTQDALKTSALTTEICKLAGGSLSSITILPVSSSIPASASSVISSGFTDVSSALASLTSAVASQVSATQTTKLTGTTTGTAGATQTSTAAAARGTWDFAAVVAGAGVVAAGVM